MDGWLMTFHHGDDLVDAWALITAEPHDGPTVRAMMEIAAEKIAQVRDLGEERKLTVNVWPFSDDVIRLGVETYIRDLVPTSTVVVDVDEVTRG